MFSRHDRCGLERQQHRPNVRKLDVVLVAPTVRGRLHKMEVQFASSLLSTPSAYRPHTRWERWRGAQREVLRNPCSTVHRLGRNWGSMYTPQRLNKSQAESRRIVNAAVPRQGWGTHGMPQGLCKARLFFFFNFIFVLWLTQLLHVAHISSLLVLERFLSLSGFVVKVIIHPPMRM